MNLFDRFRSHTPPAEKYEREFMCSVDGDLHPESAFDVDLGLRDEMCMECRDREVRRDERQDNEA